MTYQRYEWTAFREADLLESGDWNLNSGDCFVMPGAATVSLAVDDNDARLSGDNWAGERYDRANDQYGQDAYVDGVATGGHRKMFIEKTWTLQGSDGKTYVLAEIEIGGHNAAGAGDDYFSFVGAVPPAGVTLTVTGACNVGGHGIEYADLGATPVVTNEAPTFDNLPDNGILYINENETDVLDVNTSDADGDAVTYSIVGGADAGRFTIDPHTGQLSFVDAPDFENPNSAVGGNNTYDVTIQADDGNGGVTQKALWVKVQDVAEADPDCITIEAEDFTLYNMHVRDGANASGGELVAVDHLGGTADMATTFNGASGTYDFTLFAQDECDGESTVMVKVNGVIVDTITLDQNNNGGGSNNGYFSEFTIENVVLNDGDTIELWIDSDRGEYVRLDKVQLKKTGDAPATEVCTITFDDLNAGDVVADQYAAMGIHISAQRYDEAWGNTENDAMIFDTDAPTGGDFDLAFNGRGNALIISEDNNSSNPDDNIGGGWINIKYDNPTDVVSIVVLDAEEGGRIWTRQEGGQWESIVIPRGTDNGAQTILINKDDVSDMYVQLCGSGAIDDLKFLKNDVTPELGSLSGTYFMDVDRNNVESQGDMGVEGITVMLLDANGVPTGATTQTDADGNYSFGDLEVGTYGVKFTDPANALDGKTLVDANVGGDDAIDSDATGDTTESVILGIDVTAGENTPDNDAGAKAQPGSLSGTYFMDTNRDGDDDGAAAGDMDVAGKTVKLLDANGDPALDIDGNLVGSVQTDATGNYRFVNLAAGVYQVMFEGDAMKEFIAQDAGNDDTDDSDVNPTTGMTGLVTVVAGEDTPNVDAGIQDPGTASLGDKVFIDANNNGQQDTGEVGVDGVAVTLFDKDGNEAGATVTTNGGMYLFNGLVAGDYKVGFADVDEFVFTTPNAVGVDDAADSDAVPGATGAMTQTVTLGIGEQNLTLDAGLVSVAPDAVDDVAKICADELLMVDVLANDTDGAGQILAITAINGEAIAANGTVTTAAGTLVSLIDGKLVIDGEAAYADLDIGEMDVENITYTVSDGLGGSADANLEVTFKGDANTLQSLMDSLPTSGTYQVRDDALVDPIADGAYDIKISGTGDARFDDVEFFSAYCLSILDPAATGGTFADAAVNTGNITDGNDGSVFNANQIGFANGETAGDNLDLVNWIVNQQFENDGSGQFNSWEVQRAIWELTDNFDTSYLEAVDPIYGEDADVDFIVNQAIANGEGFMAGSGDLATLIIDPNPATQTNSQPFIVAFDYEEFDCFC